MLLNAINRLLPLHNFYSAFLISFKQYLKLSNFCLGLKYVFQLFKIRHTSLNPG
jgi:hypothetical protein